MGQNDSNETQGIDSKAYLNMDLLRFTTGSHRTSQ